MAGEEFLSPSGVTANNIAAARVPGTGQRMVPRAARAFLRHKTSAIENLIAPADGSGLWQRVRRPRQTRGCLVARHEASAAFIFSA